jgi:hypothetical protein
MRTLGLFPLCAFIIPGAFAQSTCGNVQLQVTPDYGFAIGSSSGGSSYTFTLGGQTLAQGSLSQLSLFHYDNSLASTSGVAPINSIGTTFGPGKWGSAVAVTSGGGLAYPAAGNLSLTEGTIEMWIAPTTNGNTAGYSSLNTLLNYAAPNGDRLWVAESSGGGLFGSAVIAGAFIPAGTPQGLVTNWKAGEWHHIAFTYSIANNRFRMYLDGAMTGENGSIKMPGGGGTLTIGGDGYTRGLFWIDEVRISNIEQPPTVIQYDAGRPSPFLDNEIYLPLAGVSAGQLTYSAGTCGTASVAYNGNVGTDTAPIMNPNPPSTLLPPGATSVMLSVQTPSATSCAYSVNIQAQYSTMNPFDQGQGATTHAATILGLIFDPSQVNTVYVRCASAPGYLLQLQYRAMPTWQSAPFPRISDIGAGVVFQEGASDLSRYALLTDSGSVDSSLILQVHKANPHAIILYWVNSVEDWTGSLPESYYLHDIHGNRIQDWPGAYLLNMTNLAVGDYQANLFHTALVDSGLV